MINISNKKTSQLVNELFDWSKQILFVLLTTLFISIFVFEPYEVSGQSMQPTFDNIGERVLAFKAPYFLDHMPNYGDIVIVDSRVHTARSFKDDFLENPLISRMLGISNDHIWIKRVIGLPEDKLEFVNGNIYRNGNLLNEKYIKEEMRQSFDTVIVPENQVFVMGDNRNSSSDSRQVGPMHLENVRGKVLIRFFPLNKIGIF